MNALCFKGSDDYYSCSEHLKKCVDDRMHIFTVKHYGEIAGYIMCNEYDKHLEIIRRGVLKQFRRLGLGIRLAKKTMKLSNDLGKNIYTYVGTNNIPSLNSNIKCGYTIRFIQDCWVHIVYRAKI